MDRLLLSQAALPHMMSTLVEDHVDNSFQLLTSGTCDLVRRAQGLKRMRLAWFRSSPWYTSLFPQVLDHCNCFWDGHDVVDMTMAERGVVASFFF